LAPPTSILSEAAAHRKAIERLAPPSILVDSTHRVIHLSETAGRYLQPSGGPLSGDIGEARQQMLLGELTHRVKNTLSVVQSIAHQSFRLASSGADFIDQFDGRLSALASAHGLLVESDWKGADLGTLARHQLDPHIAKNGSQLTIVGEPLSLPADLATPFGLVFHELATNAAKYGSLSRPTGKVRLHWTLNTGHNPHTLTVVWQELGGPRPNAPSRVGFGTTLIERGIPNATVTREFLADGLVCTIAVPIPD
jgi:two-component system, chemotaxis family, CheB/CheR fusion protein